MTQGNQEVFRLGLIGCGGISYRHGRAGVASDKARIAACCDIREAVAKEWSAEYGCEAFYTDFEEMIRVHDLDGVALVTWPSQHREQIERCLNAGARNILCEKALTVTGQDALEIAELVESAGAVLMEGFMYRHHPLMAKLERLVGAGKIGRVDSVNATFSNFDPEEDDPTDPNRNWSHDTERAGGTPWNTLCYAVNAANHFASVAAGGRWTGLGVYGSSEGIPADGGLMAARPLRVFCSGKLSEKYGTIFRQFGLIEYDSGCIGIVESSRQAYTSEALSITGSEGRLHVKRAWRPYEDTVIEHQYGRRLYDRYEVPSADIFRLQMENFVDVARGVSQPVVPLTQSVGNMYTLEALTTSVLEHRPVDVELPATLVASA
ncbi:MAG: Gfo/Idh/MocA family oxidoreductase [Chloroflexota bacterium]|nr:Gfo/Idh/MocA family oxidoreductase [Chloroflexota bacterium]MDE2918869.1 Gfo/Idh/MocA family oxidoreductase [Chloroflexota bacterium]